MKTYLSKETFEKASVVWLILSSGSVFYSKINMFLCVAIMVFLSAVFILRFHNGVIGRQNILTAGLVLGYGLLTCLANRFRGFSLNDFLILAGELLFLATVTSFITARRFQEIFVTTTYVMAAISLVCFAFVLVFPNVSLPFEMSNSRVNWTGTFYYTLGFYGRRSFRNAGVFGEGGVYQIFLNLALFYLLQSDAPIKQKKRKGFVLILAILTTISSMGYIVMVFVIMSLLVKNKESRKRYYLLCFLCILAIIVVDSSTGLLIEKILNKGGSFGSRYDDTIVSIETANEKPLLGHGMTCDITEAWEAHVESPRRMTNPRYVTLQRSSGIGIALMRCGYPFLGLYLFAMYSYFKRSINRGLIINLIGTLILVLGLVNEPIQFTPIFLLSFFTWRTADKEGEIRNV